MSGNNRITICVGLSAGTRPCLRFLRFHELTDLRPGYLLVNKGPFRITLIQV